MLEMLMQWYRRRFSDPEAIALLVILLAGFGIMFFFSGLLAPLLVAIVLAYLLEWPTIRLERIGLSRTWATSLVLILFVGIPAVAGLCGAAGSLAAGESTSSAICRAC
ncbi:permease PerM [Klebsiella pneumoniae]|uniref:Permease PerM n=1 Tax=Klebsiella pneumoniae TaxID=573 RepID=A0A3S4IM81_KLEPN|nr:permease PerM [Klebsiella pneumoniae]